MRLAREEVFGPVLVAIRWSDKAEAIRMANDSHYGLAAYVWTHNIGAGLRTAHAMTRHCREMRIPTLRLVIKNPDGSSTIF